MLPQILLRGSASPKAYAARRSAALPESLCRTDNEACYLAARPGGFFLLGVKRAATCGRDRRFFVARLSEGAPAVAGDV